MLRIIFTVLFFTATTYGSVQEIKKQYNAFQKKYSTVLASSKNKNEFIKNFNNQKTDLIKKQDAFLKISENIKMTPESIQINLDLEMLEPLEFLASSRIDKDSCSEADLLNEMNSTSDPDTFQKIKKSLQTLCK